jgi:hypothetical protein
MKKIVRSGQQAALGAVTRPDRPRFKDVTYNVHTSLGESDSRST